MSIEIGMYGFSNATRYTIFHTFLWKYGNGEMVSYTDLTRTEKIDLKD